MRAGPRGRSLVSRPDAVSWFFFCGQDGRLPLLPRPDPGNPAGWSLSVGRAEDSAIVITARGEFDVAAVPDVHRAVIQAANSLGPAARIIVDLSQVTFLDAAMLGALVTERQALQLTGGDLIVAGVTPWSLRIIEICGLRETLGV